MVHPDKSSAALATEDPKALFRWNQLKGRVGISRSAFLDRVKRKEAPQPVKVGRATFWVWGEVVAWREKLIESGRVG